MSFGVDLSQRRSCGEATQSWKLLAITKFGPKMFDESVSFYDEKLLFSNVCSRTTEREHAV